MSVGTRNFVRSNSYFGFTFLDQSMSTLQYFESTELGYCEGCNCTLLCLSCVGGGEPSSRSIRELLIWAAGCWNSSVFNKVRRTKQQIMMKDARAAKLRIDFIASKHLIRIQLQFWWTCSFLSTSWSYDGVPAKWKPSGYICWAIELVPERALSLTIRVLLIVYPTNFSALMWKI